MLMALVFLEYDPLCANPYIGHQFLTLDPASQSCDIECPELVIDLGERPHFDTEPILVTVQHPPIGTPLKIKLAFDEAYHLPYLVQAFAGGILDRSRPPNYRRNIYLLGIGGYDPVTTSEVLAALKSSQEAYATQDSDMWIDKHNNHLRTDLEEQRSMFNKVCFTPVDISG
jgi:hypothetical protein